MNLAQFQIILQKINALDKNISMDGKISSIEKDLMKAYVSQLYEACVGTSETEVKTAPIQEIVKAAPIAETPVTQVPPTVETPVAKVPTEQAPDVQAAEQVIQAPTQKINVPVEPIATNNIVDAIQEVEVVTPEVSPQISETNTSKSINDRSTPGKTIADAHMSNNEPKSLNDRLAGMSGNKTFNDKFNTEEPVKKVENKAPIIIKIPDSLKNMDTNSNHVSQQTSKSQVIPPVPPVKKPVVQTSTTVIQNTVEQVKAKAPNPVTTTTSVNDLFAIFDSKTEADELAGKWGSTPISDLSKSIGLNDKISMIRELFSDDQHAFTNSLTQLNNMSNFEEAKDYIMRNLVSPYNWNQSKKLERAKQFINLVKRRYS